MARRFFVGNMGDGRFRLRQSAPGHDALTASLDNVLFDADFYPGRVIGEPGEFYTTDGGSPFTRPAQTNWPHGLGFRPDLVLATARAINPDNSGASEWYSRGSSNASIVPTAGTVGSAQMSFRSCTPFYFEEQSVYTSGVVTNATGGWEYTWDHVNIYIINWCVSRLLVRWHALEL